MCQGHQWSELVRVSELPKSLNSDCHRWHSVGVVEKLGVCRTGNSSEPTHRGQASCPIPRSPILATEVAVHWPPEGRKLPLRPAVHKAPG